MGETQVEKTMLFFWRAGRPATLISSFFAMASDHNYWVYIVSDNNRSTIYIGVTNDLERRVWEHRNPEARSFSQTYHRGILLYSEHYPDVAAAIAREKQLKGWTRRKKIALIQTTNPRMMDLAEGWF